MFELFKACLRARLQGYSPQQTLIQLARAAGGAVKASEPVPVQRSPAETAHSELCAQMHATPNYPLERKFANLAAGVTVVQQCLQQYARMGTILDLGETETLQDYVAWLIAEANANEAQCCANSDSAEPRCYGT